MTIISSPWASPPIITDGNLSQAGWHGAGKMALGTEGTLWVKNDSRWLYVALDMTSDSGAPGDKDGFWLTIDVDGNRQITPHVDINFGPYPTADTELGFQHYLRASEWTGLSPLTSGEEYVQAVKPSPADGTPHRVWQMKLALAQLGVEFSTTAIQTIGFGVLILSSTGAETYYPPNFDNSFADLNQIVISHGPSGVYPSGTEGPVLAGVGFIPATLISAGLATTPSTYTLYPGLVDYAFCGTMQIKGNHVTVASLWSAGARNYQVFLDGEPLLTSWNNYVWDGSTFVLQSFAPDAHGQYPLYDPSLEYIVADLLVYWDSVGAPAGLHSLTVKFYEANGTTVVASTAQTLELMIDNNLPLTVFDSASYEGLPVATCAIEPLGGSITFSITASSDLGHLESYSLVANWDAGSATLDSDSYASHVSASGWDGVTDEGPVPAAGWKPAVQCAYQFLLTAYMRTTNGVSGNPYSQASRFIAFINPPS